ncbi:MAG TPA: NUDIX domain-containing protein [Candidatus Acidoferrum sp.]|nr:NUDIX domain-containing protein [Candidatus Acidoferrum sp.]
MENWAEFDRGVFLVNLLGIIYNKKTKTVLIGRRKNDPYIKELTWVFPGGRPDYGEELDSAVKRIIKKKVNLDVKVDKLVFAKTYPEKREFLSLYYLCEVVGGNAEASDDIIETKWVKPTEVKNYFTTSLHDQLFEYLKTL